jgi:hypothetical protein
MTTWDEYVTDLDNPELDAGTSGDIRDLQAEVEAQETQAILSGDVELANTLDAQWKTLEDAADHTEAAEQDTEWARESGEEAQQWADDAAKEASYATADDPRFMETAAKDMYGAEIAGEASTASLEEAGAEYTEALESMESTDFSSVPDTAAVDDTIDEY